MQLLASVGEFNLVVGDEFRDVRLDLAEASVAPGELVKRLAAEQGLAVRVHNGIRMVASSCRLGERPVIPDHKAFRERIGLSFHGTEAREIFQILADFSDLPLEVPGESGNRPMTVKTRPYERGGAFARDVLAALATVQGFSATPGPRKGIRFIANPKLAACPPAKDSASIVIRSRIAERKECLRKLPNQCAHLEVYELEDLRFIGVMVDQAKSSRLAVVSLGSHAVAARTGDPLGRNGGRIASISDSGVVIEEPAAGADGKQAPRIRTFAFQ
jgi:hypothetical protein